MLICLPCYLEQNPEAPADPFNPWQRAEKVYDQCEICLTSTRVAEIE
jgi:hypothetical protein